MKLKLTAVSLALLFANNVIAADLPAYYDITEETAQQDAFGPYPVALSEDGLFVAAYSTKASLSSNIDIGLPFTFNRECQYDTVLCDLEFYGSENSAQLSYENAYRHWRIAQSNAKQGNYVSYMMGITKMGSNPPLAEDPFNGSGTSDVKTTDVTNEINSDRFIVGYASAAYVNGAREFSRRAYMKSATDGTVTYLLPEAFSGDLGGFSSAYKIKQVTVGSDVKTFVIGAASRSFPKNSNEYFQDCYNSDQDDDRRGKNELVRCPGFDTQAWVWDVTEVVAGTPAVNGELSGKPLATHWLNDNETAKKDLTYSANAFDINKTGLAVGTSTFEFNSSSEGGRQRAIIMSPESDGSYGKPVELTAVTSDIEDQKDWICNTWALTVSDAGVITGNREYNTSKGRNKPIEFFVYDNTKKTIKFPLLDKKVTTTKQRLESGSHYVGKSGANSRLYDANESGLLVGEIDDYDQLDPVYQASSRAQTAFLFNNKTDEAWLINDLICKQVGDVVTTPLIRIRSARVINDAGVVLAEGFKYQTQDEYRYKTKGVRTIFRLTPNPAVTSPSNSANCWKSSLLDTVDEPYERSGAATFWLWLFALPLLFIRRLKG